MQVVFLVDDHPMIIEGLRKTISEMDVEMSIHCFADAESCLTASQKTPPNILITDLGLPGISGCELAKMLMAQNAKLRILFITTFHQQWRVRDALNQKPYGFIFKDDSIAEITAAIEALLNGETYFSASVKEVMVGITLNGNNASLTRREVEVVKLIAKGKTTVQIADCMCVSVNTVESYRKALFNKLGVKNSTGLLAKAFEMGIVGDG